MYDTIFVIFCLNVLLCVNVFAHVLCNRLGKFSVSDRHPIWPKLPKTSIIDIALHVCEVISEGKLQMSE